MKFLNSLDILGSGGTLFDVQGSQGQLFSVTDSLSGSIFAVSDISGVPILDVNSSGTSYFSGNVGIGTAAPGAPLQVNRSSNGINQYIYNTTSGQAYIAFGNATTGLFSQDFTSANGLLVGIDQDETAIIWNAEATRLRFGTSGAERMSIAAAGNVGIGTTSPDGQLDVTDGNSKMVFDGVSSDRPLMYFQHNAVPVDGEEVGLFDFRGYNSASQDTRYAIWTAKAEDVTDGTEDGSLQLMTMKAGTATTTFTGRSGKVGIANANPAQALDVTGKIRVTDDIILAQTNGRIDYDNGVSSGALRFFSTSGNTERMRITSAGKVGIGTTSPGASLHVASTTNDYVAKFSHTTATGYAPGSILLQAGQAVSRGQGLYHYNTEADESWFTGVPYNVSSNKWIVANKPDTTFNPDVAQLSHALLTIQDSGQVGIGTTSPARELHVKGNNGWGEVRIEGQTFASGHGASLEFYSEGTALADIYASTDKHLYFRTNGGTERMRITSAGRVGIGTTNPAYHIHGLSAESGWGYSFQNATGDEDVNVYMSHGGGYGIAVDSTENASDKYLLKLSGGTGGGAGIGSVTRMIVTAAGNVGIGTTDPSQLLHTVGGTVKIESDGSNAAGAVLELKHANNNATDVCATINFTNNIGGYAAIEGGTTGANNTGYLAFKTDNAGTQGEAVRILGNGNAAFAGDVSLVDSKKLILGTGSDLEIYHDPGHSYITNNTGDLTIDSQGDDLILKSADDFIVYVAGTEIAIQADSDGRVALRYDNTVRFQTTSTGVEVTGKITNLTAGTGNLDAVNVQQLNNATTGTLVYKGTWSAAPTTTSVLDGAVSGGTIVIDAANPGISVGATITGTGISGTVTVSNIAADGITIAISSSQTIADGVTLTFTTVGGTPDLSQSSRKVTGHYYICEAAGAATPNGASTTPNEWAVGDWATFSDLTTDAWQKIDNSSVLSGAGTGGKVPVWSGTGTSVTLADAPITVSGNNATFAGTVATGNMTISGQEIDVSSGDLTLDVAGDIVLDADGGDVNLADGGTFIGRLGLENGDLNIASAQQDYDIRLKGNDGGSIITALHLDMSAAGAATFSGEVTSTDDINALTKIVVGENATAEVRIKKTNTGNGKLSFYNNDGTSSTQQGYLSLDANEDFVMYSAANNENHFYAGGVLNSTQIGANTNFAGNVTVADSFKANFGAGSDLQIFHNGSNSYIETSNTSVGDFYVTARGSNHDLYLEAADNIYIRPQGNENGIKVLGNDSVELYFNNVRKIRTTTGGVIVEGDVKVGSALLSNQENTDVDTGTETVASVLIATYTAAFFDFVIKNGTNLRAGTVFACHDGTNVVYTETSTNDLGDTSDVTLSVDISGTDMRLRATVTSNDWSVKSLIRAI